MTQGYGPQDPNQPDYGQQPPQYPYGGQPPPYGTPAQPGPAGPGRGRLRRRPARLLHGPRPGQLAPAGRRLPDRRPDRRHPGVPGPHPVQRSTSTRRPAPGRCSSPPCSTCSLGIWIYNRAILMGRTGQSWGKQVLKLRLVRMADGQPMGRGMAFLRDLLHILDALLATSASCGRSGTPGASACSPTRS